MSDVKLHVNANVAATFDGSFLCLKVSFWAKKLLEMSQNGKLLMIKQC